MNESLILTDHQLVKPIAVLLMVIAFAATLALGFGLRAWTEDTSGSAGANGTGQVVHHAAPQPLIRLGKPW